jgi:hypothetical protein
MEKVYQKSYAKHKITNIFLLTVQFGINRRILKGHHHENTHHCFGIGGARRDSRMGGHLYTGAPTQRRNLCARALALGTQ